MYAPQVATDLGFTVLSLADLIAKGAASPAEAVAPSPDDLCTIMYTSGRSGGRGSVAGRGRPCECPGGGAGPGPLR